jgi:hypothetical protein
MRGRFHPTCHAIDWDGAPVRVTAYFVAKGPPRSGGIDLGRRGFGDLIHRRFLKKRLVSTVFPCFEGTFKISVWFVGGRNGENVITVDGLTETAWRAAVEQARVRGKQGRAGLRIFRHNSRSVWQRPRRCLSIARVLRSGYRPIEDSAGGASAGSSAWYRS